MKKYIAPAINILNIATDESIMLTVSGGTLSDKSHQLSNKMDESDWEDEE